MFSMTFCTLLTASMLAGGNAEAIQKDKAALQGSWKVIASEKNGEKSGPDEIKDLFLVFKGDVISIREAGKSSDRFTFKIDPTKSIKEIDIVLQEGPQKGRVDRAIYRLDGKALAICIQTNKDSPRPREFVTRPDSNLWLVVLERSKE
jgi:uncharacterized protein (TIGR03067 family)